ncbi:MAG: DUF2461 domain-containing protein [Gaiellales bacterium]
MAQAILAPALFRFLKDLSANNDRAWFEANRARYEEELLDPALEFIEAFAPHLRKISSHFVAAPRRSGGSLFRIHRDVRFSKDKSPYKTNTGIQFRHEQAKDVHSPGFYLHLEPGSSFAAVGIWHPDSNALTAIRDTIVESPNKWKAALGEPFGSTYRLGGDALVRPPSGYDREHPLIDDLKRKDFIGVKEIPDKRVTSEKFLLEYSAMCRAAGKFMRFLCEAVGVPF